MIHIASEVVAVIGMAYYFSSQNKKLLTHVEELAQRIEEQEDQIKNLENMIRQLAMGMNTTNTKIDMIFKGGNSSIPEPIKSQPAKSRHEPVFLEPIQPTRSDTKIQFNDIPDVKEDSGDESEDESDSDLDEEIREEIEQLDNLKKDQ